MRRRLLQAAAAVAILCSAPLRAQSSLYVITGTPSPDDSEQYPSRLVRMAEGGSAELITELVPKHPGIEWMAISYDRRKAVIVQENVSETMLVLDLDRASIVKRCKRPLVEDGVRIAQWLADVPGRGPTFEWHLAPADVKRPIVQGMVIDPSVPCAESFTAVDPSEIRNVIAHGSPGVGDTVAPDGIFANIDAAGNLNAPLGAVNVPFDYRIPPELLRGISHPFTKIVANNSQILVLSVVEFRRMDLRFLAFRKRDKTWHTIPVQSDYYGRLRGFGNYVAIIEGRVKKYIAAQAGRPELFIEPRSDAGDVSAGKADWSRKSSGTGPDLEDSFDNSLAVYPGRLHVYDIDSGHVYMIATNQADSEVLLIESSIVYYRVTDRLYSAPITEKGIGSARIVATDELIRDAHWAFIKH